METTSLMQHIRTAASKLNGCKLKRSNVIAPTLDAIGKELQLASREETMILVAVLDRQCTCRNTELDDLANYFECSALDVMEFVPAINSLISKGYISTENKSERLISKKQFMLCPDVFYAIIEGRKVQPVPPSQINAFDQFDFCEAVHNLIEERDKGSIETEKVFIQTKQLEEEYSNMPLVKGLKKAVEDIAARTLFYEMCKDFTADSDGGHSDLNSTLQDIYDRIINRVTIKKQLMESTHPLMAADLIEICNDTELHLTENGIRLLFGEASSAFVKPSANLDRYAFVNEVYEKVDDLPRRHSLMDLERMYRNIEKLEKANLHLNAVSKLRALISDVRSRLVFYLICYELVDSSTYNVYQLHEIYMKHAELKVLRLFKEQQHILQKLDLVELTGSGMLDGAALNLTDKGKEFFLEEDAELFEERVADKELIQPDKIPAKQLFFEPALNRQLSVLQNSLDENHYPALCARLKEKHLPTGVAVLLYGLPGTGKTESVMQMARSTGRAIMHVDISATKTCWFGESEKLIKEVFTKYRKLCEKSKIKPILLFNEADTVFSKRKDANSSSVAQTENAIQNIILEEMENLDGILIATTNLADNLDAAFERRFLFKIRFDKPTTEAKANIWLNKLPSLSESDALQLASRFDFSGGEIDNIVRKATMEEIINGTSPTIEFLIVTCNEEKIGKATRKVGFTR